MISEVDQSDIELHNRQKALVCDQHKDMAIKFYCTDCDKFSCHTCEVLYHKKHDCIRIEDADAKLCMQINNSVEKVQEIIIFHEKQVEEVQLSKETLKNDTNKLLKALKNLVDEVQTKMQAEFDKIVGKLNEYYKNLVKSISEKTEEKIIELENNVKETQRKLQSLKDTMSLFKKHTPPLSTPPERASFLKDNPITQLTSKLVSDNYSPVHKLPDIDQWKNDIENWNQSAMKLLHSVTDLPQLTDNSKPVLITSRSRFVYVQFYQEVSTPPPPIFSNAVPQFFCMPSLPYNLPCKLALSH